MNTITVEFACKPGVLFHPVAGTTITETYNEQLDSMSLFLDHVSLENRLTEIAPYTYVRVKDDTHVLDRLFLVNDYFENEISIRDHIYSYQISLMSETKWLEKFQLPNLTITHEVNPDGTTTKKPISHYIRAYMALYVPKVKVSDGEGGFNYEPIIRCPEEGDKGYFEFEEKFGTFECADMGSSANTLRQVITTLMQQVGCIPVVRNRILGFLDFKAEQVKFNMTNDSEFSQIQRSLSSDSYVNTLVSQADQVLDSGNTVISESIGFRDSENVLIRQLDNLHLETKFPIYKVNSVKLKMPVEVENGFSTSLEQYDIGINLRYPCPYCTIVENADVIPNWNLKFQYQSPGGLWGSKILIDGKVNYAKVNWVDDNYDSNDTRRFDSMEKLEIRSFDVYFSMSNDYATHYQPTGWDGNDLSTYNFMWIDVNITGDYGIFKNYVSNGMQGILRLVVMFDLENVRTGTDGKYVFPLNRNDSKYRYVMYSSPETDVGSFVIAESDITQLVRENGQRNLLNNNFSEFMTMLNRTNPKPTLEDISRYRYGTVGYSIGDNVISGFSETFSDGDATIAGWVTRSYTVMESIYKVMCFSVMTESLRKKLVIPDGFPVFFKDDIDNSTGTFGLFALENFPSLEGGYMFSKIRFSTFIFDLEYQPLNSYSMSYIKSGQDIPVPIEQYNSSGSSLSDFDRLSISMQETVDKIGQETVRIPQRTRNLGHIQPLNSITEDGNVVFNRVIRVNPNHYNVLYTASRHAVLKDFFTSIRTKYRAFANVSYSQSVLRKERDLIHVYIGKTSIDPEYLDRKLLLATGRSVSMFIDGILRNHDERDMIKYVIESDGNQFVKNDISVIVNSKSLAIVYEQSDNASMGTYFENPYVDKSLGGMVQKWQEWEDVHGYNESHQVIYTNVIPIKANVYALFNMNDLKSLYSLPIVMDDVDETVKGHEIFRIVTDRKKDDTNRIFHKDAAERINHTVQFAYYTDSDDIEWTELFIRNCSIVQNAPVRPNTVMATDDDYELNGEPHGIGSISDYPDSIIETGESTIKVKWSMLSSADKRKDLTVCHIWSGQCRDFIRFRNPGTGQDTTYYCGLNDTRTFSAYRDDDGMLILEKGNII